jgi:mannose-6-phosphate isomerase class I
MTSCVLGRTPRHRKNASAACSTSIPKPSMLLVIDFLNFEMSNGLPFLFKVLSIQDPLSIQVHPDKLFAEIFNKSDIEHYKDNNHKPELAIVISP